MSYQNEEVQLLPENGSGNDVVDLTSPSRQRCAICAIRVVAAASFLYVASNIASSWSNNKAPELSISGDKIILHRELCEVYGSQSVEMVQTSLGAPSEQWSPITCVNTKDKADLNVYGVPDAVIQADFSKPAHPDCVPIMGFGGAFTEASALNYQSLSEKGREAVMELLFGKSGLGYSLGRVHMNSCDFSPESYSFDNTDGDLDLKEFDTGVEHDVSSGMIDMMVSAASTFREHWGKVDNDNAGVGQDGNLKILASPWSPPAWMKAPTPNDSNTTLHAESMTNSAGNTCLREGVGANSRYAKAWALYFSKFVTAYSDLGVPLFAVTVQNEPEFAAPWEACSYTPVTEGDFVANHLGPTLKKDHPDLKIFVFDHNKDHVVKWATKLLDSTNPASKFIDGVGYHWYAGGMDRLLDGAVGSSNMHRLTSKLKDFQINQDQMVLGTESCHCPSTGYAGGDLSVAWSRAQRYSHTVLADLAAGSSGWIEWNLVLDSIGGPNHLGNMCDAPLLAVPHRTKGSNAVRGENGYALPSFEHADFPFGPVVGDFKTREELHALGNPAEFLDAGVIVQPLYYYMGHIARYVRPGSRAVMAIVNQAEGISSGRIFRPSGQVVVGGGQNDLARNGIELGAWPCDGSTRQQFKWNEKTKQIQVFGHDWQGNTTTTCIGNEQDKDFNSLLLTHCYEWEEWGIKHKPGLFNLEPVTPTTHSSSETLVKFKLINGKTGLDEKCIVIDPPPNRGGAYGPRGGGMITIGNCNSPAAKWNFNGDGEIASSFFSEGGDANDVCVTTGWPFLHVGAFETPNGDANHAVVILNEAGEAANYVLKDGDEVILAASIPAHSIQTLSIKR